MNLGEQKPKIRIQRFDIQGDLQGWDSMEIDAMERESSRTLQRPLGFLPDSSLQPGVDLFESLPC
jgi:hypothetical protein